MGPDLLTIGSGIQSQGTLLTALHEKSESMLPQMASCVLTPEQDVGRKEFVSRGAFVSRGIQSLAGGAFSPSQKHVVTLEHWMFLRGSFWKAGMQNWMPGMALILCHGVSDIILRFEMQMQPMEPERSKHDRMVWKASHLHQLQHRAMSHDVGS